MPKVLERFLVCEHGPLQVPARSLRSIRTARLTDGSDGYRKTFRTLGPWSFGFRGRYCELELRTVRNRSLHEDVAMLVTLCTRAKLKNHQEPTARNDGEINGMRVVELLFPVATLRWATGVDPTPANPVLPSWKSRHRGRMALSLRAGPDLLMEEVLDEETLPASALSAASGVLNHHHPAIENPQHVPRGHTYIHASTHAWMHTHRQTDICIYTNFACF